MKYGFFRADYLTLNGKEASLDSHQNKPYKKIAFNNEILKWLHESQEQVSNITNLNNAIGYYIDVIKMLIGKYESPINQYKGFFLNQDIYDTFEKNKSAILEKFKNESSIEDGFKKAKKELYNSFYKMLLKPFLEDHLDITFYAYDIKNEKIVLIYDTYFEIWIPIVNNNFKSIGIRPAWNSVEWQGNEYLKQILDDKNKLLGNSHSISDYLIGKKKGKALEHAYGIPQPTVENLFLLYREEKISDSDINFEEIYDRLKVIKDALKEF